MNATQGASVSLTGFGQLKATTTSSTGQHGYVVEHPKGHAEHIPTSYFIKPPKEGDEKKLTAGNFFAPLAAGLKGAVAIVWKCTYKAVHGNINPTKPFVMTTHELKLEKGKPVHVGGPAVDA